MAERGPGGREVGRVSLRVLPDTSKFLPSLKKYAERVERTVAVRLGTTIDGRGLERDAARISERIERTVPTIRIPTTPISDGFAREMQRQVAAASKSIQANIPLTADGERLRRQVLVEVAELEAQIQRMELEVPLDVESAARAKAELRARIAGLQALAARSPVTVPIKTGGPGMLGGAGVLGISPAAIAGLGAVTAVLAGGLLASLPAIIASLAGPVAVIALGFKGIATAAKVAAPAFEAMRQALSNTFATELAPVFATLAEVLPKITPQMQAIAEALSGTFGGVVDALASPEGIAALQGILQGVADAITILAPAMGPMTDLFLRLAETGMAAFVDMAPGLLTALQGVVDVFTYLNDAGVIDMAVKAFAGFVIASVVIAGAIGAILTALAAVAFGIEKLRLLVVRVVTSIIENFRAMPIGIAIVIASAVAILGSLPARAVAAIGDLGGLLYNSGRSLVQGFIDGLRSMLSDVGSAAGEIAQKVKDFFPGSPVKQGPLTSWNGGGSGKLLGHMLADGLEASRSVVASASSNLAKSVAVPTAELVGAGVGDMSRSIDQGIRIYGDVKTQSPEEFETEMHQRRRRAVLSSPGRQP